MDQHYVVHFKDQRQRPEPGFLFHELPPGNFQRPTDQRSPLVARSVRREGIEHVLVVAQHASAKFLSNDPNTLSRFRAVANHIPETIPIRHSELRRICEHRLESVDVGVYVAKNGDGGHMRNQGDETGKSVRHFYGNTVNIIHSLTAKKKPTLRAGRLFPPMHRSAHGLAHLFDTLNGENGLPLGIQSPSL